MPTYFNLSFQFKRNEIYGGFMDEFYAALDNAGMKFRSGYWECENLGFDEIKTRNQAKLEENFRLGFTEHVSNDYAQTLFDFSGFSEVRGFWMNNYPEEDTFSFDIIIPEDDVLACEYPVKYNEKAISALREFSEKIWNFSHIKTIQTGLEADDAATGLTALAAGKRPNLHPFAVLEHINFEFDGVSRESLSAKRDGVLLLKKAFG